MAQRKRYKKSEILYETNVYITHFVFGWLRIKFWGVPMGKDTYMVSRQAATGFSGMVTLKAGAMREAYSQCQKTRKSVEVIETVGAKPPYIFGNFPNFKCVE